MRHRLQLFRLRLRDSKLTCALASHAQPRRHALPDLHLFSLRGEGAEATRAVPHRSPPASSPKINAGPSSRGPEAPSPLPIRGCGGERRAFVPQQNRTNLPKISQAAACGPRGCYVTARDPRGVRVSTLNVISFIADVMTTTRCACPSIEMIEK